MDLLTWLKETPGQLFRGDFYAEGSLKERAGIPADHWGATDLGLDVLCRVLEPVETSESLNGYGIPEFREGEGPDAAEDSGRLLGVCLLVEGPLQYYSSRTGFSRFVRDLMKNPAGMREVFSLYTSRLIRAAGRCRHPVSALVLGDDMAGSSGLMYSPGMLENLYYPRLMEMVSAWEHLPVIFHSDGDISPVLGDLAACRIAGIHSLERVGQMDPDRLASRHPDLLFWGGISRDSLVRDRQMLLKEMDQLACLRRDGLLLLAGSCTGILDGQMDPELLRLAGRFPPEPFQGR